MPPTPTATASVGLVVARSRSPSRRPSVARKTTCRPLRGRLVARFGPHEGALGQSFPLPKTVQTRCRSLPKTVLGRVVARSCLRGPQGLDALSPAARRAVPVPSADEPPELLCPSAGSQRLPGEPHRSARLPPRSLAGSRPAGRSEPFRGARRVVVRPSALGGLRLRGEPRRSSRAARPHGSDPEKNDLSSYGGPGQGAPLLF
jgi:hypothetical protein